MEALVPSWYYGLRLHTLDRFFEKQYDKAEKARHWDEQQSIAGQWEVETAQYRDELSHLATRSLLKTATKFHLDLSEIPLPEGCDSHWENGKCYHRYLRKQSYLALQRKVRNEQHDIWEFRIKAILALTGLLGSLIGL